MSDKRVITALKSGETKQVRKLVFSIKYAKDLFSFDSCIDDIIENVCDAMRINGVNVISSEQVVKFFDKFNNEIDETWEVFKKEWIGNHYLEWFFDKEKDEYTFTLMRVANEFKLEYVGYGLKDEVDELIMKSSRCVEEGFTHTFASYEEGVRNCLKWIFKGGDKPEIICSEEDE